MRGINNTFIVKSCSGCEPSFTKEGYIQTSSEGKCKRKAELVELALNAHSYTNKGILTVEVLFQKHLGEEMLVKLDKFYSKHMFPEILTRHIKNLLC